MAQIMYPTAKEEYLDKWLKVGHLYWKSPDEVFKVIRRTKDFIIYTKGELIQRYYVLNDIGEYAWEFKETPDKDDRYIRRKIRIQDGLITIPYDSDGIIKIVGSFDYDPSCFYSEFQEEWSDYEDDMWFDYC